jgi:hypothetical protein
MNASAAGLLTGMVFLSGCGTMQSGSLVTYQPVVDPKMITNSAQYQADLVECNQLAMQSSGGGAWEGLLAGLLVGAAYGAIGDDTGLGARMAG